MMQPTSHWQVHDMLITRKNHCGRHRSLQSSTPFLTKKQSIDLQAFETCQVVPINHVGSPQRKTVKKRAAFLELQANAHTCLALTTCEIQGKG
eukprot:1158403-Pelagomonas_calceolata.AAC.3